MANFVVYAQSRGIYAKLVVTEQGQSVDNNQTTLGWAVYMWNPTGNWYSYSSKNAFRVTIGGTTVWTTSNYGTVSLQNGQSEAAARLMGSGTITITHEASGTKSLVLYLYAAQEHQSPHLYQWEASSTVNLTTIPRASQPSCVTSPNTTAKVGDIGSTITIYTNRASTSFVHRVEYVWGNKSGVIAQGVTNNVQWTIPMDFCNDVPSGTVGTGTIKLFTYSGSTYIGEKSVTFYANVPSNVIPNLNSLSISMVSSNATINNWGLYVKGYSSIRASYSSSGAYSSSISRYVVNYNNADISTTSNPYNSGTLNFSGSRTFYCTAYDTRGRASAKRSVGYTVYDYSNPKISGFRVLRTDSDQKQVSVYAAYSISSVNGKNAIQTAKLSYKRSNAPSYTDYDGLIINGSTVTISGFSEDSGYDFQLTIIDSVGNPATSYAHITTAKVVMDFRAGGKGLSIGKISEMDAFEVAMNSYFYNPVRLSQGSYAYAAIGKSGTTGPIKIATIEILMSYRDAPISFQVIQRHKSRPATLNLAFQSSSTSDPELLSFKYLGEVVSAYLYKASTSVWELYIQKTENYDQITISSMMMERYTAEGISVTFSDTQVDSVPNGAIQATLDTFQSSSGDVDYAVNAGRISTQTPQLAAATESNAITVKDNANDLLGENHLSIRKAIDFAWYNTHWQIGNLRGGDKDSAGFGIAYTGDGKTWNSNFKITPGGETHATIVRSDAIWVKQEFELMGTNPHIDFHFNNSESDYTARIIETSQGALTAYNSISSASDKRLKKEIEDVPDKYVELIEQLLPHLYRFKDGADYKYAGLIAQEVIELEKELGIKDSVLVRGTGKEIEIDGKKTTDYYSIDYNALLILLLKYTVTKIKALESGAERGKE